MMLSEFCERITERGRVIGDFERCGNRAHVMEAGVNVVGHVLISWLQ